jgi:hypothetical protein
MRTENLVLNLDGRLGIDERTILECILGKEGDKVRNG